MKTASIVTAILFLGIQAMSQSWNLGSDFNLAQPVGAMTRNMNNAVGMTFHLSRNFQSPFAVGFEFGFGTYGQQKTRQKYTFEDGTVTETNVNVSNNIFNTNLSGKYFFRNGQNINPYLSAKLGWTWFSTTLTIEDPKDPMSCHPLESDVLFKDNTYTASVGAGVRIDFNTFFKRMESGRFYFDLNVHAIQGGSIRFMNVEKDPSQPLPDKDVMAKFINTQTQVIHEHHVGYVYTSLMNMVDYRLGVVCRPGWR